MGNDVTVNFYDVIRRLIEWFVVSMFTVNWHVLSFYLVLQNGIEHTKKPKIKMI